MFPFTYKKTSRPKSCCGFRLGFSRYSRVVPQKWAFSGILKIIFLFANRAAFTPQKIPSGHQLTERRTENPHKRKGPVRGVWPAVLRRYWVATKKDRISAGLLTNPVVCRLGICVADRKFLTDYRRSETECDSPGREGQQIMAKRLLLFVVVMLIFPGCSGLLGGVSSHDRAVIEKWLKDPKTRGGLDRSTGSVSPVETRDSLESIRLLDSTSTTRTYEVKWYGGSQAFFEEFAKMPTHTGLYVTKLVIHDGDDNVLWKPATLANH